MVGATTASFAAAADGGGRRRTGGGGVGRCRSRFGGVEAEAEADEETEGGVGTPPIIIT